MIPPPVKLAAGAVPFCIRNLSALMYWKGSPENTVLMIVF
jgi:hypothetical protein